MHESLNSPKQEVPPNIPDFYEALDFIKDRLEKGERPIVTVPKKYAENLTKGLEPHSTWIPGVEVIAGTLGREPYVPGDEERFIVEVDVPVSQIQPRMTGKDKAFHGVVVVQGPVPPDKITIH